MDAKLSAALRGWWSHGARWDVPIVIVALAMIVALWAVTLDRIAHEQEDAVSAAVRQNTNLAIALEEHTLRTFKSASQAVLQVAREFDEEGMRLDIARFVRDGSIDHAFLTVIGIADERGAVILDSLHTGARLDFSGHDFFTAHRDASTRGLYIGAPLKGPLSGEWAIPISVRRSKPDGSFAGVVFAGIFPGYFTDFYRRADIGHDGLINMMGLDGITRARRAGDKVSFGQDSRKSTLYALQRQSPSGQFRSRGVQEGIPRFQSYRTLEEYPLVVAVGMSEAEVLAEFRERQGYYFLGSGLATAFITALAGVLLASLRRQRRARREIEYSHTVLATQQELSPDAMLLVDENFRILLWNRRFAEMWKLSPDLVQAGDDVPVLKSVVAQMADPEAFRAKVDYLYSHREENSYDELRTRDGRTIDRHSAPMWGANGRYFGRAWFFRDVTERRRAESEMADLQTRLQTALTGGNVGLWDWDLLTNKVFYSSVWLEQLGYEEGEFPDELHVWERLMHPDDLLAAGREIERCLADPAAAYRVEFRMKHKSGEWRWMLSQGRVQRNAEGLPVQFVGCHIDITERKQIEDRQRLSDKVISSIADGVVVTDADRRIIFANDAFTRITGYTREEAIGRTPALKQSGRQGPDFYAAMWRQVKESGHWQGEIWNRRKSGEIYPELLSISAMRNGDEVSNYVGVFTDISASKQYEERLHYLAHHDALTGLSNRLAFQDRSRDAIGRVRRRNGKAAVLFLDLDHFKNINDSLGHDVGDLLLQAVAGRITAHVRETDTVARFGGDEFAVLLEAIDDSQAAAAVAHKLVKELALPFQIGEHQFFVSVSIGISCFPQDGADPETLAKNADTAMYRAKAEGRNTYQFFSEEMNARALENLRLGNEMRAGLERGEFFLHYQPRVEVGSGRVTGAEALVRWRHPDRGVIPPARFIPLAEESGLIEPLGEWVLRSALRQMRAWLDSGVPIERIAVNLSARQFRHPDLPRLVADALEETRVPARHLELEVTESMVMHKPEDAAGVLARLKAMGIAIAIDDFGTGYSSLSYLKRFPLDFLKIDQSFIRGVPSDIEDGAIVRTIIAMAKSLKLGLIAEGVETAAQRQFLLQQGCDEAQGYLFSRPIPAAELEGLLECPAAAATEDRPAATA